jgi:tetratricopeptide (TPR) repeat protein
MKRPLFFLSLLFLFAMISVPSFAQRGGSGGGGRGSGVTLSRPRVILPDASMDQGSVFLTGKVVLDDGGALSSGAAIQTVCRGQKRTETYTDSAGNFSFQFASKPSINTAGGIGDADATTWVSANARGNQRSLQDCELQAELPGFTSQVIELSRVVGEQHSDVGRVVLHRMEQVQGFTISATSAAAPDAARKAFEKGLKEETKNKPDEAQKLFEKAVGIYDRYAVAWFELGRLQAQKNDDAGARHSFAQALLADSAYVSPYRVLAQMAAKEKQWPVVVEQTGKLLALNPVSFPDAWFLNAVGHYFMRDLDTAEKSARQGLKLDEQHHFPKFEYLLGMVLVDKRNYSEAADHMRRYIALSTAAPDIEAGKKELAQIETLAPNVAAPAVAEKK